ncbi:MAG TPA: BACON domain-containing carbohydrate-binding protein [Kofleriaceae bacterium]|nr:BACON domain-containing carbohydrate-binding protein [Kofleriaceae bacterium]
MASALAFAIPACQAPAVSELTSASTVYAVGPTRTYHTLQELQGILQAGDQVDVDYSATPYPCGALFQTSGTASQPITIHGIVDGSGRRPLIKCGVNQAGEFSAVEFRMANHWVFENFEIDGNRSGGNGFDANQLTGTHRLIRTQSDDITIRNVYLHNCPAHGILSNDDFSGSLTLEYSEIADCGNSDTRHSVYISTDPTNFPGATCHVRYNYIHDGANGILLKTRCQRNEIYYNWLENFPCHFMQLIGMDDSFPAKDANGSVIPYNSDVVGNVFYQPIFRECYVGQGDSNAFTLGHDWWEVNSENTSPGTWGEKRFVNNTVVLPAQTTAPVFKIQGGIKSVEMHNNVFKAPSSLIVIRDSAPDEDIYWTTGSRQIAGSYNWVVSGMHVPPEWTSNRSGSDPGFTGAADFRPAASSPLVDAGSPTAPAFPAFPFPSPTYPPGHEPVRAATSNPPARVTSGTIDIGAFESSSGAGCSYSISPSSASPAAAGGSASVAVTAASGCSWVATSNDSWITITGGASGTGGGTVSYSVAQNTSGARAGTMTIAGQTFTVTQAAGGSCTYSLSPTSSSPPAAGNSASVSVTAGAGCSWTATSNAAWITITAGSSGTGSGTVSYTVAQNTGGPRSGTLTIAGQTFTVNQAAAGGTELLANPGFESWSGGLPTSWTKPTATTVTQSTTTHGGSSSCQVQNPDWAGITQVVTGSKPSGTTLTGTAWVKWVAGPSTSPFIQLVISYSDGTPADYVGAASSSFTTSGWYQLTRAFTVAHPVSSVGLGVLNNSGVSQTFLVDDASLDVGGGCVPTTCAAQAKDCGTLSDGCGGTLTCGTCTGAETCGAGGIANVCGVSDLLSNPDLEAWSGGLPTSWTKASASTVTQSTSAHGGSSSCQVQNPDWMGITQTVAMTRPSGTTFTGTAWVKWVAGATTSPYVQLVISYSDGNPPDYVGAANPSFTTSGWYQLTRAFTVTHPVSSTDLNVVNNSGAPETWLVDDASLTTQ